MSREDCSGIEMLSCGLSADNTETHRHHHSSTGHVNTDRQTERQTDRYYRQTLVHRHTTQTHIQPHLNTPSALNCQGLLTYRNQRCGVRIEVGVPQSLGFGLESELESTFWLLNLVLCSFGQCTVLASHATSNMSCHDGLIEIPPVVHNCAPFIRRI